MSAAPHREPTDPRVVAEVRIPAASLRPGDLVNLSPGEDDWQEVLGVYLAPDEAVGNADLRSLVETLGGRYVVVELTDLTPVDNNIEFTDGQAYLVGSDGDAEQPVSEVTSSEDGMRTYLYTKYELVTIRG